MVERLINKSQYCWGVACCHVWKFMQCWLNTWLCSYLAAVCVFQCHQDRQSLQCLLMITVTCTSIGLLWVALAATLSTGAVITCMRASVRCVQCVVAVVSVLFAVCLGNDSLMPILSLGCLSLCLSVCHFSFWKITQDSLDPEWPNFVSYSPGMVHTWGCFCCRRSLPQWRIMPGSAVLFLILIRKYELLKHVFVHLCTYRWKMQCAFWSDVCVSICASVIS